jgi:hypothetical protein
MTAFDVVDSDDFRDAHERAFRAHIVATSESHICDALCSTAISDRMLGRTPNNEDPVKPWKVRLGYIGRDEENAA